MAMTVATKLPSPHVLPPTKTLYASVVLPKLLLATALYIPVFPRVALVNMNVERAVLVTLCTLPWDGAEVFNFTVVYGKKSPTKMGHQ